MIFRGMRNEERGTRLLLRKINDFIIIIMNDFFYKKVDAYHIAKEYVIFVYSLLRKFPQYETYALCDQIRRAAVSIPSNIAEGLGRVSVKERIHFMEIAFGSLAEVSCQLDISESLGYISANELQEAEERAERLSKVMSGLKNYLATIINSNM